MSDVIGKHHFVSRSKTSTFICFFPPRIKIYPTKQGLSICEFLFDSDDISINTANMTHGSTREACREMFSGLHFSPDGLRGRSNESPQLSGWRSQDATADVASVNVQLVCAL